MLGCVILTTIVCGRGGIRAGRLFQVYRIELKEKKKVADTRYSSIGGKLCENCNSRYKVVWKAPDNLWYAVTRKTGEGLICPRCFDALAAANGLPLSWKCFIPTDGGNNE